MRSFARSAASFLALSCVAYFSACARPAATGNLAFTHVTIVDVEKGVLVPEQTIVVDSTRISAVGPSSDIRTAPDARIVDGTGTFVIPGIWDMHTHITESSSWLFPMSVALGVTGLRDMGGPLDSLLAWKTRLGNRDIAPRVIGAGPIILGAARDPDPRVVLVRDPATASAIVDSLTRRGVDFIKVHDWVPRDVYLALAAAAKARGTTIAGHLPVQVDVATAVQAGQRSIEHDGNTEGGLLLHVSTRSAEYLPVVAALVGKPFDPNAMVGSWPAAKLRALTESFSEAKADSIAKLLANGHVAVTPTFLGYTTAYSAPPDSALLRDPRMAFLPRSFRESEESQIRDYWSAPRSAERTQAASDLIAARVRLIRALLRNGVLLLAGTDFSSWPGAFPGYALHDELAALVRDVGLTPAEALRTATINPARFLNATDSLGTIAPGKLADFVLLSGDPLTDIRRTRDVRDVVLNGNHFDNNAVKNILAGVRGAVAVQK